MKIKQKAIILFLFVVIITSCKQDAMVHTDYKTGNVIIVMIDGPRYSETWGDPSHQYIQRMANELSEKGVIYSRFYNKGPTYTNAGHTAVTTGHYQEIDNSGLELPKYPSIFQHWLQRNSNLKDGTDAWIIASKDKLEVLSDCIDTVWKGKARPSTNCGVNGLGLGSGYRDDSLTYVKAIEILTQHHPQLVLIQFREPDFSAHSGSWSNYTNGIIDTDELIYKLWDFIESDSIYRGSTSLFVTNDHGRHLDSIGNGFISHGDDCDGCRHINLFAYGPDFKSNIIIDTEREQIDIPVTIAELLRFNIPNSNGEVMRELFK